MNWLKSRLFWRIIGIYVLLSTLALGGLLITLTERLRAQAREVLEAESRQLLQAITAGDSVQEAKLAALLADWGPLLSQRNQSLAVLDSSGAILMSTPEPQPLRESTRGSLARSARRSGLVTQWAPLRADVLATAVPADPKSISAAADSRILVLQSNVSERLRSSDVAISSARRAAIVAWLCGTACLAFVASSFVGPLRMLVTAITSSESSRRRSDMLLRLADRTDEFGQIAASLTNVDADRSRQLAELQTSETQIRALATRLSAVLQSMVEGVVAVDGSERILFANEVAQRLMGLDAGHVEGRLIHEAIRSPHVHETVREAIQTRDPATLEFRLPRSDVQLSMVAAPIILPARPNSPAADRAATGRATDRQPLAENNVGAVIVFHDVTEIRRLESMRRDFVSGVSHELKTPLTVIQACTETLLDGALEDRAAAERFLKQIEEQSERLLQLILGMLQLARVETGEQAFRREPVAVHEMVASLVQSLRPVAEGRRIHLQQTGVEEMYLLSDFQALRTVLSNLVDNGIKYTQEGGEVAVELVTEERAHVIRVRDNGRGIPEKHRRRVFERFYRVERDRNRERGGTGLGLAIVKHLCGTLGAELDLQSQTGRGTTVTIRFPLDQDQA